MSRLCIVPAKEHSTRCPGKNMRQLGDKPLICHTLDVVKEVFDYVIFTSDGNELLHYVNNKYLEDDNVSCYKDTLVNPNSKVIDIVKDIYSNYNTVGEAYDSIWMSLPTCPFKTSADFLAASELLNRFAPEFSPDYYAYDSVVSTTDFDFPPSLSLNYLDEHMIESTCPSMPWERGHSKSQEHRKCYRPNGAIYGCRWDDFGRDPNWYRVGRTAGHYMPPSVDVDTEQDFRYAEFLLKDHGLKVN